MPLRREQSDDVLIGRFLRVRSSAPASPPFADTLHRDNPALFRSRGLRVRFFHTKRCSCQRWQDSDARRRTRPDSNRSNDRTEFCSAILSSALSGEVAICVPSSQCSSFTRLIDGAAQRKRDRDKAARYAPASTGRGIPANKPRSQPAALRLRARSVLSPEPYRGSSLPVQVASVVKSKHARALRCSEALQARASA